MRKVGYCGLALSCWLSTVPIACSDTEGTGTGEAAVGGAATTMGGASAVSSSTSIGGTRASGGKSSDDSNGDEVGGSPDAVGSVDVGGTEPPPDKECAQRQVPIQALPPDIMIVMDRSISMSDDVSGQICEGGVEGGDANCGEESKWYKTIVALKDVVEATQKTVNWGMYWLGNESTQCGVSTTPVVPITPGDSYTPIQEALDGVQFNGQFGTPTAGAINASVKYMSKLTDENPKYLLVATDGEPNCAAGTTGGGVGGIGGIGAGAGATMYTVDTAGATAAVANAANADIPTFVIGIATTSTPTATEALNAMAVAGGNPQKDAETQYYAVSDTETLKAVLNEIIGMTTSCTISLENAPKGEWKIAISAQDANGDTVEVVNDATDGWVYTDESTKKSIELNGAACANLKKGTYSNLQFVYTCPTHEIIL